MSTPTGLRIPAQGFRTLGFAGTLSWINPEGVVDIERFPPSCVRNPFRVEIQRGGILTQGLETLGWNTQSRWDLTSLDFLRGKCLQKK